MDVEPATPPGMENIEMILSWILWGAGLVLFMYFIFGIVQAGRARRDHQAAEAPIWPLAAAAILGAAGTVWALLV